MNTCIRIAKNFRWNIAFNINKNSKILSCRTTHSLIISKSSPKDMSSIVFVCKGGHNAEVTWLYDHTTYFISVNPLSYNKLTVNSYTVLDYIRYNSWWCAKSAFTFQSFMFYHFNTMSKWINVILFMHLIFNTSPTTHHVFNQWVAFCDMLHI